jgi:hypothetical protein
MYLLSKYDYDAVAVVVVVVVVDGSNLLLLHDCEWLFVVEAIVVEGEGSQMTSWKASFLHGPVFEEDWWYEDVQCCN